MNNSYENELSRKIFLYHDLEQRLNEIVKESKEKKQEGDFKSLLHYKQWHEATKPGSKNLIPISAELVEEYQTLSKKHEELRKEILAQGEDLLTHEDIERIFGNKESIEESETMKTIVTDDYIFDPSLKPDIGPIFEPKITINKSKSEITKDIKILIRQLKQLTKNDELALDDINNKLEKNNVTINDLESIDTILENNKNNLAQYYWVYKDRIKESKEEIEEIQERKIKTQELIENLKQQGNDIELLNNIELRLNNENLTVRDLENLLNLTEENSEKMEEEYARNSLNMIVDEINTMYRKSEKALEECKEKLASDKYTIDEKAEIFLQTSMLIKKALNNEFIEDLKQQNVTSDDEHMISTYAKMELINNLRDVLSIEQIQELNEKVYEKTEDLEQESPIKTDEPVIKETKLPTDNKEQEIKEIQQRIEELNKEIEKLDEEFKNNDIDYTTWNSKRTQLVDEIEKLREKLEALKEKEVETPIESIEQDDRLEIEKIEARLLENQRLMSNFILENKVLVKAKLKSKINSSNLEVEQKNIYLSKLDTDLSLEEINEIINDNHYNNDAELIIEILEDELKEAESKEELIATEENKEEIIKIVEKKLRDYHASITDRGKQAEIRVALDILKNNPSAEKVNKIIRKNRLNQNSELDINLLNSKKSSIQKEIDILTEESETERQLLSEFEKETIEKYMCNHFQGIISKELNNDNNNLSQDTKDALNKIQNKLDQLLQKETIDTKEITDIKEEIQKLGINIEFEKVEEHIRNKNDQERSLSESISNKSNKIFELEKEKNDIQEKIDKQDTTKIKRSKQEIQSELEKFKSLDNKNLTEIKNSYYQIRQDIITELENNEEFLEKSEEEKGAEIFDKIINHNLHEKLQSYSNYEKLIGELSSDIFDSLTKKKEEEKSEEEEKTKKDWKKYGQALAKFATGFALGVGITFTPLNAAVGTIIVGTKIVKTAAKIYTDKCENPDNTIVKIIDKAKEMKEKFAATKIGKFVTSKEFKYGFVGGYIVGNVYQALDSLSDKVPTDNPKPKVEEGEIHGPDQVEPPIISKTPGIGDTVDVTGLKGFANSLGEGKTSIIQELAGNAEIIGKKNGYYLLNGSDGELLGWYKASDIETKAKIVKEAVETIAKVTK